MTKEGKKRFLLLSTRREGREASQAFFLFPEFVDDQRGGGRRRGGDVPRYHRGKAGFLNALNCDRGGGGSASRIGFGSQSVEGGGANEKREGEESSSLPLFGP